MKKRKKIQRNASMPGWLVLVVIVFTISALNFSYLLIQRIIWLFTRTIGTGVYISMFLLLIYCYFMWSSIYLILKKRKKAVKFSIIALITGFIFGLWFYLIGRIIFTQFTRFTLINGIPVILFNLILIIIIIFYLKKSKRVKATLTR